LPPLSITSQKRKKVNWCQGAVPDERTPEQILADQAKVAFNAELDSFEWRPDNAGQNFADWMGIQPTSPPASPMLAATRGSRERVSAKNETSRRHRLAAPARDIGHGVACTMTRMSIFVALALLTATSAPAEIYSYDCQAYTVQLDVVAQTISWSGHVFSNAHQIEGCRYQVRAVDKDGSTAMLCTATPGYAWWISRHPWPSST
jgi:hypothetical protein